MTNEKIHIDFEGGISLFDGYHGCNYMIGKYKDSEGDEQELYAEKTYEKGENVDDFYGYDELKKEIIRQATQKGISLNQLDFF